VPERLTEIEQRTITDYYCLHILYSSNVLATACACALYAVDVLPRMCRWVQLLPLLQSLKMTQMKLASAT